MDPDLASVTQEVKSIIAVQDTDIVEDPTNLTQLKIIARVVSIVENCKCYSFENMIIKLLIHLIGILVFSAGKCSFLLSAKSKVESTAAQIWLINPNWHDL